MVRRQRKSPSPSKGSMLDITTLVEMKTILPDYRLTERRGEITQEKLNIQTLSSCDVMRGIDRDLTLYSVFIIGPGDAVVAVTLKTIIKQK